MTQTELQEIVHSDTDLLRKFVLAYRLLAVNDYTGKFSHIPAIKLIAALTSFNELLKQHPNNLLIIKHIALTHYRNLQPLEARIVFGRVNYLC